MKLSTIIYIILCPLFTVKSAEFSTLDSPELESISVGIWYRAAQLFITDSTADISLFSVKADIVNQGPIDSQKEARIVLDQGGYPFGESVGSFSYYNKEGSFNYFSGNISLAPNTAYWVMFIWRDVSPMYEAYSVKTVSYEAASTGEWAPTTSSIAFYNADSGGLHNDWTLLAPGTALKIQLNAPLPAPVPEPMQWNIAICLLCLFIIRKRFYKRKKL